MQNNTKKIRKQTASSEKCCDSGKSESILDIKNVHGLFKITWLISILGSWYIRSIVNIKKLLWYE